MGHYICSNPIFLCTSYRGYHATEKNKRDGIIMRKKGKLKTGYKKQFWGIFLLAMTARET